MIRILKGAKSVGEKTGVATNPEQPTLLGHERHEPNKGPRLFLGTCHRVVPHIVSQVPTRVELLTYSTQFAGQLTCTDFHMDRDGILYKYNV